MVTAEEVSSKTSERMVTADLDIAILFLLVVVLVSPVQTMCFVDTGCRPRIEQGSRYCVIYACESKTNSRLIGTAKCDNSYNAWF